MSDRPPSPSFDGAKGRSRTSRHSPAPDATRARRLAPRAATVLLRVRFPVAMFAATTVGSGRTTPSPIGARRRLARGEVPTTTSTPRRALTSDARGKALSSRGARACVANGALIHGRVGARVRVSGREVRRASASARAKRERIDIDVAFVV